MKGLLFDFHSLDSSWANVEAAAWTRIDSDEPVPVWCTHSTPSTKPRAWPGSVCPLLELIERKGHNGPELCSEPWPWMWMERRFDLFVASNMAILAVPVLKGHGPHFLGYEVEDH